MHIHHVILFTKTCYHPHAHTQCTHNTHTIHTLTTKLNLITWIYPETTHDIMHTYVRICTMRMYLLPSREPSLFLPASEKKLGRLGSRLSTTVIYTYTFTTTMCMHACIHANSHPHMKTSLTHPPPNTHTPVATPGTPPCRLGPDHKIQQSPTAAWEGYGAYMHRS